MYNELKLTLDFVKYMLINYCINNRIMALLRKEWDFSVNGLSRKRFNSHTQKCM